MRERKSIDDEREFYRGKSLPLALARRLDESEAKFTAMTDLLGVEQNDIRTIVERYRCERAQFAVRWRGGAPGSSACAGACKTGAERALSRFALAKRRPYQVPQKVW